MARKFARKANLNWHNMGNADLKGLLDLGIEEPEILEASFLLKRCAST